MCTARHNFSDRLLNRLNTHTDFDNSAGECWCFLSQVLVAQAHPNDWTDGVKKLGVYFCRALGGEQKISHRVETPLHPDLF